MSTSLMTAAAQTMCSHAGTVTIVSSTSRVMAAGSPVVTQPDTFIVAGCPFVIGNTPSPCTAVQYSTSALRVKVEGKPVLLQASSGVGVGAGPQGPANHVVFQPRVKGT